MMDGRVQMKVCSWLGILFLCFSRDGTGESGLIGICG